LEGAFQVEVKRMEQVQVVGSGGLRERESKLTIIRGWLLPSGDVLDNLGKPVAV